MHVWSKRQVEGDGPDKLWQEIWRRDRPERSQSIDQRNGTAREPVVNFPSIQENIVHSTRGRSPRAELVLSGCARLVWCMRLADQGDGIQRCGGFTVATPCWGRLAEGVPVLGLLRTLVPMELLGLLLNVLVPAFFWFCVLPVVVGPGLE